MSGLQGESEVQQRAQQVQAAVAYQLLTSYYEREPAALDWLSKLEVALFQAGSMQPGSAGPELPGQVRSSERRQQLTLLQGSAAAVRLATGVAREASCAALHAQQVLTGGCVSWCETCCLPSGWLV